MSNINTIAHNFNNMPYEIQLIIINKMACSDIIKLWNINPNSHFIIQDYLNKNNFESIDNYIFINLNKYISEEEPYTLNNLLQYKHRIQYILYFYELGYYYEAKNYCTIKDEHIFNNFIKLLPFFTHLQDPFDIVSNLEHSQSDKLVSLYYNTTNLSLNNMYHFCCNFDDTQINKCIEFANLGYNEKDIYDIIKGTL